MELIGQRPLPGMTYTTEHTGNPARRNVPFIDSMALRPTADTTADLRFVNKGEPVKPKEDQPAVIEKEPVARPVKEPVGGPALWLVPIVAVVAAVAFFRSE